MQGIYRFINTDIPTPGCNLRCEYCYIKQHGDEVAVLQIDTGKKLFRYPVEHMIRALTAERLGGACMFNISGSGETLLNPDIVELTHGLLENGHFVALINNCTVTDKIQEFAGFNPEYRKRLFFKVSFHYRELKRKGLLEKFTNNVHMLKNSGIAFSIEVVSNDFVLGEIEELQEFSKTHFGALPHVLAGRDEQVVGEFPRLQTRLSPDEYDGVWSSFDSDLYRYQQKTYELPHNEFCYAGVYTGTLSLATGDFTPCPGTKKVTNFFEDIDSPIIFAPVGENCPFNFCFCGFFLHVLAGVSRSYDPGVYFYQFRDRTCPDGSHWLTPTIKEVFSHRCSEYHEPYLPKKMEFINAFMRKVYSDGDMSESEQISVAKTVGEYLRVRGYNNVAIYGMGKLGRWLEAVLHKAGVDIAFVIDKNASSVECSYLVYSPDDKLPEADAIIVSVYSEFSAVAPKLREKTDVPIVSVISLADDV